MISGSGPDGEEGGMGAGINVAIGRERAKAYEGVHVADVMGPWQEKDVGRCGGEEGGEAVEPWFRIGDCRGGHGVCE